MKRYSVEKAIEKLNEVGITTKLYTRPPMGKTIFVIGIGGRYTADERICLWPGMVSTIELSTNKKLGQAVMSVYEEEQEIDFITKVRPSCLEEDGTPKDYLKKDFRGFAPLNLPENTECISVKNADDLVPLHGLNYWDEVRIKFTVKTPSEERHFFLGHDAGGKHVFISMLPKKAASVKEAHDILRPDEVPEGTLRQGEFFFLPTPKYNRGTGQIEKNVALYSGAIRQTSISTSYWSHQIELRRRNLANRNIETDHCAEEVVVNWSAGVQHVRGTITNARHEPLVLDGWHKVVKNNEVPNPTPTRRSWD